ARLKGTLFRSVAPWRVSGRLVDHVTAVVPPADEQLVLADASRRIEVTHARSIQDPSVLWASQPAAFGLPEGASLVAALVSRHAHDGPALEHDEPPVVQERHFAGEVFVFEAKKGAVGGRGVRHRSRPLGALPLRNDLIEA